MVKHNNVIPNGHFKKHGQNYVKTWFNQPARKTRRRNARQEKAVKDFPRLAGALRPQIHGQTLKYNMKLREGREFSLEKHKLLLLLKNPKQQFMTKVPNNKIGHHNKDGYSHKYEFKIVYVAPLKVEVGLVLKQYLGLFLFQIRWSGKQKWYSSVFC